jgi:hypothetical protein
MLLSLGLLTTANTLQQPTDWRHSLRSSWVQGWKDSVDFAICFRGAGADWQSYLIKADADQLFSNIKVMLLDVN